MKRMLSPATPRPALSIGAVVYHAEPGKVVDVDDRAAITMREHGWIPIGPVGTSSLDPRATERPQPQQDTDIGIQFIDIAHESRLLTWDGRAWRDTTGAIAE